MARLRGCTRRRWPGPELPERLEGRARKPTSVSSSAPASPGLSAALHLREAGVDVAIVEAAGAGLGRARARNNGQVIPTLTRPDPEDIIVAKHRAAGERFAAPCCATAPPRCSTPRQPLPDPGRAGAGRLGSSRCTRPASIATAAAPRGAAVVAPPGPLSGCLSREPDPRRCSVRMPGSGGFWNRTPRWLSSAGAGARACARPALEPRRPHLARARPPELPERRERPLGRHDRPQARSAPGADPRHQRLYRRSYIESARRPTSPAQVMPVLPSGRWPRAAACRTPRARPSSRAGRRCRMLTHGDAHFARYDARNRLVTGGASMGTGGCRRKTQGRGRRALQRLWPANRSRSSSTMSGTAVSA